MELEYLLSKTVEVFQKTLKCVKYETFGAEEAQKLSLHHFAYITAIQALGNPTFTDLAEKLNVTKPSVTAMVNKLIKEGYVRKQQSSEDRRIYHLYLDDKGKQLIEVERKGMMQFADRIRCALTEQEARQFAELLKKILQEESFE
jgi:DNA-binding MarR family transcriptional regulator